MGGDYVTAGAKLTGSASLPLIVLIVNASLCEEGGACHPELVEGSVPILPRLSSRAIACPERSRTGGISVPSQIRRSLRQALGRPFDKRRMTETTSSG
jgi:hypothetical protein